MSPDTSARIHTTLPAPARAYRCSVKSNRKAKNSGRSRRLGFSAAFGPTPDSEEANLLYAFCRLNKQALHHLRSHVESSENRVCAGPYLQYRAGGGRGITPQGFSSGKGLVS